MSRINTHESWGIEYMLSTSRENIVDEIKICSKRSIKIRIHKYRCWALPGDNRIHTYKQEQLQLAPGKITEIRASVKKERNSLFIGKIYHLEREWKSIGQRYKNPKALSQKSNLIFKWYIMFCLYSKI